MGMNRVIKFLFGTLSIVVALIAIAIGYLKLNDVYRQKCEWTYPTVTPLTAVLQSLRDSSSNWPM